MAKVLRKIHDETLDEVLDYVRTQLSITEEIEGVVMVLKDRQQRYKIKTKWYLNSAKILSENPALLRGKTKPGPSILDWTDLPSSSWSDIPYGLI